jgi:hypothetical protein
MANALSRIISNNTSQIMDEISTSLDDSLNMPRGEAMNLRERLEQHIAGVLEERGAEEDQGGDIPTGDYDQDEAVPTPRMSEPESSVPTTREVSHPAMYDLIGGPDSEEYGGESTVWMNDQDHREAEVSEEGPPTVRRPRGSSSPQATQGMYDAVRSGAYNAGTSGAYNAVVSSGPTSATALMASPPAMSEPEIPPAPWAQRNPKPSRSGRRLALVAALAVVAAIAIAVALHLHGGL